MATVQSLVRQVSELRFHPIRLASLGRWVCEVSWGTIDNACKVL